MSYDFWNNPLVVSSFRLKFRRGNPWLFLTAYPCMLFILYLAITEFIRFNHGDVKTWRENAIYFLMGLQYVLSGILACAATSTSMKMEVVNQTLDFQRISSLSSRQILLGKLFGEPMMAFFLAVAIYPVALLIYALGTASLESFIVLYVNLFSHIFLCAATGLVMQLEAREDKKVDGGLISLLTVPSALPLFVLVFSPLQFNRLWLLGCPIVHVLAALLSFRSMERRFENPLLPPLSKRMFFSTILFLDLALSCFLLLGSASLFQGASAFCFVHLIVAVMSMVGATPSKEALTSWVWRYRMRNGGWADGWLGDRSDNRLAVVTSAGIGVLGLILFVVMRIALTDRLDELEESGRFIFEAALLMSISVVMMGFSNQWLMATVGKKGSAFIASLLAGVPMFVPYFLGQFKQCSWMLAFSPISVFNYWEQTYRIPLVIRQVGNPGRSIFSPEPFEEWSVRVLGAYPIILVFAAISCWFSFSIRKRLLAVERTVERKLQAMGVVEG